MLISVMLALQVTRDSFPRHLMAVWRAHNFKYDLMRGFEKTGIFPHNPEIVLGKVYTPPTADPCLSESPRKKKFLELTNLVLSEYGPRCGIQSTQVSAMLESIKAHIDGTFFMWRFMT